jgi:hypothetical protein
MKNNGSNSMTLDMKLPMMMEGNFEPHFSVKHMLKDVVIATRLARNFGIEFGATDASRHGLTEEMRQGRGDADYSSLFRQYFPGGELGATANGEEQPSLAGLDEAKRAEPEAVPVAVETSAEVPSEAKPMGEVVAAPVTEELKVEEPKLEEPKVEELKVEEPKVEGELKVEESKVEDVPKVEEKPKAEEVAAAVTSQTAAAPAATSVTAPATSEPAPKEEPLLSFPAPKKEEDEEAPRGLWGGFWRRRED